MGEGGGGVGGGGNGQEPGMSSYRVEAGVDLHTGRSPVGRVDSCDKEGDHQMVAWDPSGCIGGGCRFVLVGPMTVLNARSNPL